MSINLLDMRDEAVAQIKAAFGEIDKKINIAAHPGQFSEADIKRLATQTPAIITSFMRYGAEFHTIDFVSLVLYRADNKDRLYDGALKIVSSLIPVIENLDADWSIGSGKDVAAECLYTGTLDQINVTMWAVKWKWHVQDLARDEINGGESLTGLEYFEGFDAAHKVGSATVEDKVNLEVSNANTD